MFKIYTTDPYIAQPATTPFMWGWDFNHLVPWMLHYPLWPPRQTHPILKLKLTKIPGSLSGSITSANKLRIFFRSSIPCTRSSMINTGCHTSFRWEIKFGYTCRKNILHDPIERFIHYTMYHIPSPRLWMTMILISTFHPSLACTQCLMWTSFGHTFHHYWHLRGRKTICTGRAQP
jgi:hypothetical protein